MSTNTKTTTTDASEEDRRCVQGIEDEDVGGSGSTTGPVNWQWQRSVYFTCFQVANSNPVSSISSRCLVLIFFHQIPFFSFAAWNNISNAIMRKIFLYQVYTNLAYLSPTYRRVKKLWVLIINKVVRKPLACKKGYENPIWGWNDSPVRYHMQIFSVMGKALHMLHTGLIYPGFMMDTNQ